MEIVPIYKAKSTKDISDRLKGILEEFGEGLVIKHPESKYFLGGRISTWVKVKPGQSFRLSFLSLSKANVLLL